MQTTKTDSEIQKDVLNELTWDTRVAPTEVGVEVDNHVVTLTGTVSSWAKRLAAAEAAHHVLGVLDVANDLVVKPPHDAQHTDTEIAAAIRQALVWNVFVREDKIQSTVTNGIVTLRGVVDHASERHDAERAIENLAGVCQIHNRITVEHGDVSKPALQAAIRKALERRADRDADRIELAVDAGNVVLTGTVHSWTERQAVVGAARGTRGVETVIDNLHLAP